MHCRLNIIFLLIFLFLPIVISCGERGQPGESIILSQQETLEYLVSKSDLIAIVEIVGVINYEHVIFFTDMAKQVDARIVSIIKGKINKKSIKIDNSPMFYPTGVLKISVALRKGRHLAFLSKDGDIYKPTTQYSLFDVYNNKVHPIWRQGENSDEMMPGYALEVIVDEIENEKIKRINKK